MTPIIEVFHEFHVTLLLSGWPPKPVIRRSGGHLMDNKRNKARQRVLKAGLITFNGAGINCLVRNISDTGAALEVENQIGIPPIFDLVIAADNFTQRCHVVWRKEKRIGIVFDSGHIR
jgi:hypothetical protein